ncbi:MAG: tetratricopeptide (TPR) repeat protein [Cognaticolwellia sp.]|jgi:tetratricopeptide (TPR) repeat protein
MNALMLSLLLAIGASAPASAQAVGKAPDAEQLMREGHPVEALEAARSGVRAAPEDVEKHELLIDLMNNLGLALQAEIAYLQFAQDNDQDPMAWYLLGRAALEPRRASTAYAKALSLEPSYSRATMGLASVQRALGEPEAAVKLYRQAVDVQPGLAEAWSGLGATLMDQGKGLEALEVCLQAMVAVPRDREAYLAASVLEPDMARDHLERGVKAVPESPELRAALGRVQLRDGDYKKSRENLDMALASDPGAIQAIFDRAVVGELEAGRLDTDGQAMLARARALIKESPVAAELGVRDLVNQYPDCYLVYLVQGHLFIGLARQMEAVTSLSKALELQPSSPDVQGALGMLMLTMGDAEQALPLLQSAYKARPWDVELGVSAGMAAANANGINAGVTALGAVADAHPTELAPVMALVTLLSQAGRPDVAYQVLSRAVSRYPHPTLILSKAAAAQDLGRKAEAAALLRELELLTGDRQYGSMALELDP